MGDMDTVTTTTPRPPGWRLVCSQTVPADSLPLATSPSVLRNMSTTECCLWTHVIHTEDSSLTPTSCPVLAHAISQLKPCPSNPNPQIFPSILILILNPILNPSSNQIKESHGLVTSIISITSQYLIYLLFIYLLSSSPTIFPVQLQSQ